MLEKVAGSFILEAADMTHGTVVSNVGLIAKEDFNAIIQNSVFVVLLRKL